MTPVFLTPKPPKPPAAWIGQNVAAGGLIAGRRLDLTATIELLRENALVRGALFFLRGGAYDFLPASAYDTIPAQQRRLERWLRQFRADDPDLAGTIAEALRLPGAELITLRNYINEDHEGQRRSLWRHSHDRAVVDWATHLIGKATGARGSVTFAEAGAAAKAVLDWLEAVDPFRPFMTRHVVISWLQDLERRSRSQRRPPVPPVPALALWPAPNRCDPPRRRTPRTEHVPSQPGRGAPDPAVWARAASGDWR